MNTIAFCKWQYECTEILWRDPDIDCRAIHLPPCFNVIMYGPMLQGSVHKSWKLNISQFSHGLHTHQACLPLSMFVMLWIDMYDSLFPPISNNFAQPSKMSGTTFHRPQSTAWSTLCGWDMARCMRQMVVTPVPDWFSDPRTCHIRYKDGTKAQRGMRTFLFI
jgi:hypothetical protein